MADANYYEPQEKLSTHLRVSTFEHLVHLLLVLKLTSILLKLKRTYSHILILVI